MSPHRNPCCHAYLLLDTFLTNPPSTTTCAEKGISPLGSHFYPIYVFELSLVSFHQPQTLSEFLFCRNSCLDAKNRHSPCPLRAHILVEEKDNKHVYKRMPGSAMTKIHRDFSCLTSPACSELCISSIG